MPGTTTGPLVSAAAEGALVDAACSDPRAFAVLYRRHVSAIYRITVGMTPVRVAPPAAAPARGCYRYH